MSKFETLVDIFENSIATYPENELFGTQEETGCWRLDSPTLEVGEHGRRRTRGGLAALEASSAGTRVCHRLEQPGRVGGARRTPATGSARPSCRCTRRSCPKEWEFITSDCGAKVARRRDRRRSSRSARRSFEVLERHPRVRASIRPQGERRRQELPDKAARRRQEGPVARHRRSPKTSSASSTPRARPATRRASASRTTTSRANVNAVHDKFPMAPTTAVAVVPAVGARLRANVRAARAALDGRVASRSASRSTRSSTTSPRCSPRSS
jgi:hypothetical protein